MTTATHSRKKIALVPALLLACLLAGFHSRSPNELVGNAPLPEIVPAADGEAAVAESAVSPGDEAVVASAGTQTSSSVVPTYISVPPPPSPLPRFDLIRDTGERKQRFYRFMYQLIEAENEHIRADRLRLQYLDERFRSGSQLSQSHGDWLRSLALRYRVDADRPTTEMLERLLLRVDTIPEELAIAQAAIESAWGCSRFARLGNNIYGQWCFVGGCGMVPQDRGIKAKHEVAAFDSPRSSVRAYLLNLNTHPSYRPLRQLRGQRQNATPDGHALAAGLQKYSELGDEYIRRLRLIMRQNHRLLQLSRAEYSARGEFRPAG